MTIQDFYRNIHGDYEDILLRLPTDAMVIRFVKRFPSDSTFRELVKAVEEQNIHASFEAAHKLKGVAANLAFTELYQASSALAEFLRPEREVADPILFARVKASYELVIEQERLFSSNEA